MASILLFILKGYKGTLMAAVKLYEDFIANIKVDEEALKALKARVAKTRIDSKANRGAIMQALTNYALYGAKNPYNYTFSDAEIEAITGKELVEKLKKAKQCRANCYLLWSFKFKSAYF